MSDTHKQLHHGSNCNHCKILDLVLHLNYIYFSNTNPTNSPKHHTQSPNHQFCQRIRYVEYYFVHVHMAWSQKFRKSEISLGTRCSPNSTNFAIVRPSPKLISGLKQESDSQIWKQFGTGFKNFRTGSEWKSANVTPATSDRNMKLREGYFLINKK